MSIGTFKLIRHCSETVINQLTETQTRPPPPSNDPPGRMSVKGSVDVVAF